VGDYLEVPICMENVSSYAEYHASEMTEWEFLSEVVKLADCGNSSRREQHLCLVEEP
jgi:uncharacterized protein